MQKLVLNKIAWTCCLNCSNLDKKNTGNIGLNFTCDKYRLDKLKCSNFKEEIIPPKKEQ